MAHGRKRAGTRRVPRRNPVGVLQVTRGGYGFVDTPEGEYFIPASRMYGAFDGDTVEIAPLTQDASRQKQSPSSSLNRKRPSARIVRVITRAHATLVGRYVLAEPFGIVVPEDDRIAYDIFTVHADNPPVNDGDLVRVRITSYPDRRNSALGTVERVIGSSDMENRAVESLLARNDLPYEFSEEALAQAAAVTVSVEDALQHGYRDLRDRVVFTIDPIDARDFDDALSLDRVNDVWRLGVHIADVSHSVPRGSVLDREARLRATSVYVVDRVLPMLPEALSNDMCSLVPGEDRRSMTVDIFLDDDGAVLSCDFYPALMRSNARFAYDQVQRILEQDGADGSVDAEADSDLVARLLELDRIARTLEKRSYEEGALDLETAELHMVLDEAGKPIDVLLREKTRATNLVEQAMILANTCVAKHLAQRSIPCIYRVHEQPDTASLAQLIPLIEEFDYAGQVDRDAFIAGDPHALQAVLEATRGKEEHQLFSLVLLRALKQAQYSTDRNGHYGLGLEAYCHFTSPIRRYPDLEVHRQLKASLGMVGYEAASIESLASVADHASLCERKADKVALQSQELKLAEFLKDQIGRVFSGLIVKVVSYGFFVRLDNTGTGLVSLREEATAYRLDFARQILFDPERKIGYRLGQHVVVRLEAVDEMTGRLDLSLVKTANGRERRKRGQR